MYLITYISFPGEAEAAINFYKEVLDAEIVMLSRMGDGPMEIPPHLKDKIMHARIKIGESILYISDTFDNNHIVKGTNASLSVHVDSPEKVDELFTRLSDGGQATMPPSDVFWGARFGMLTDKFGIHWMVNCELKK